MAKLYSNENFPFPVVKYLRELGHNVLTVQETVRTGQLLSDEAVLSFASAEGRSVLTLNRRHFIRLHNEKLQHAGIVVCTFDPDFAGQAKRIHDAIGLNSHLSGRLIRVNRPAKL